MNGIAHLLKVVETINHMISMVDLSRLAQRLRTWRIESILTSTSLGGLTCAEVKGCQLRSLDGAVERSKDQLWALATPGRIIFNHIVRGMYLFH